MPVRVNKMNGKRSKTETNEVIEAVIDDDIIAAADERGVIDE